MSTAQKMRRPGTDTRGVTVYPVGRRRWRVEVTFGGRGSRRRIVRTFEGTRLQAIEHGRQLRDGGPPVDNGTLAAYFNGTFLAAKRRTARIRTVETYQEVFELYIRERLGSTRLRTLLEEDAAVALCERWLAWLASPAASRSGRRLSPRSQQKAFRSLYTILCHAARGNRRAMNPLDAIDLADRPCPSYADAGRRRALPLDLARAIVDAFDGHELDAAVALALGGGLRRGEVLGVPLDAVADLPDGTMRVEVRQVVSATRAGAVVERDVAKTAGSLRTVVLPRWAEAKVRRQIVRAKELRLAAGGKWQEHGLLFPATGLRGGGGRGVAGGPTHPTTFTRGFRRRLREAGVLELDFDRLARGGVRLHDLRHSAVTLALESGVPVPVVSRRVGHSRLETTMGYFGPEEDADRRAAAASDDAFGAAR